MKFHNAEKKEEFGGSIAKSNNCPTFWALSMAVPCVKIHSWMVLHWAGVKQIMAPALALKSSALKRGEPDCHPACKTLGQNSMRAP